MPSPRCKRGPSLHRILQVEEPRKLEALNSARERDSPSRPSSRVVKSVPRSSQLPFALKVRLAIPHCTILSCSPALSSSMMLSQRLFVFTRVAVTDPGPVPDLCIEGGRIPRRSPSLISNTASDKVFNVNSHSPRLEKVSWNARWDHFPEVGLSLT